MKRRGLQLSRRHRWFLHTTSLVLLLTGVAWAWLHRLDEAGNLGDRWRSLKPALMTGHGLMAAGFVLLLGTLLPVHVRHAWHARRNRGNGAFFLTVVSVLTLSGYSLYYLGDETLRARCSDGHLWLGVVSPLLLFWHIWSGRRAASKAQP